MAGYEIEIKRSAAKEIEKILRKKDRRRIADRIARLKKDPRPRGCKKLSGQEAYRIRQGSYRIVYAIDDDGAVVTVIKVEPRRDVYR